MVFWWELIKTKWRQFADIKLVLICGLVVGLGIMFFQKSQSTSVMASNPLMSSSQLVEKKSNVHKAPKRIYIDIKGAVKHPAVYPFKRPVLVHEVILRAGGLKKGANTKQLNFAQTIGDGQMIYVPQQGEASTANTITGSSETATTIAMSKKFDLNQITETELQTLPGIGPKRATDFVQYREKKGTFNTIEDLKEIPGFGDKTLAKLKDYFE